MSLMNAWPPLAGVYTRQYRPTSSTGCVQIDLHTAYTVVNTYGATTGCFSSDRLWSNEKLCDNCNAGRLSKNYVFHLPPSVDSPLSSSTTSTSTSTFQLPAENLLFRRSFPPKDSFPSEDLYTAPRVRTAPDPVWKKNFNPRTLSAV